MRRRDFLQLLGLSAAAGCGLDIIEVQPTGSEQLFRFAEFPQLARIGGGQVFEAKSRLWTVGVVRTRDKEASAFDPTCTHLSCTLEYKNDLMRYVCPCHRAEFAATGEVLLGPAEDSLLTRYTAGVTEEGILVSGLPTGVPQ